MKSPTQQIPLYQTSDLGIAVFLFTVGHELKTTTLQGSNRLIFCFQQQDGTEGLVGKYLNGTALAPAKTLFENYRGLRALAYNKTGNSR